MEGDAVDGNSSGNCRAPSQNPILHVSTAEVEVGVGSSGLSFV